MNYINKNKGMTFVTVTHNNFWKVLNYLEKVYFLSNKKLLIILICDGVVDHDFKKNANKSPIKVLFNNKNIGKLASLLKWKDSISTNRFKVIDSDDCINYDDAFFLHDISKEFKNDVFYLHKAAKITNDSEYFGKITTDKTMIARLLDESKDVSWSIPPNAKAIYNTFILFIPRISNLKRQNYFNDDFLSILNILFTRETINIDLRPYIQYHSKGQTSKISKKRYLELKTLNNNLYTTLSKYDFVFDRNTILNKKTLELRRINQKKINKINYSKISDLRIRSSERKLLKSLNKNIQQSKKKFSYEKVDDY